MATRKNGSPFGDFSGSIDTVVFSSWMGIIISKSKPGQRKKKTTSVKLIRQNNMFGMVSSFFRSAKQMINMGYQKPKLAKMTPNNAITSYHLKNAMSGDGNDIGIILSKIKFTFPIRKTQSAWKSVISSVTENNVTISWETNPFPQKCTQLDDKVILVYYNKNRGMFYCIWDVIERSDLSFTRDFSKEFAGDEIHWYMFLISADGKLVSETDYLGMVTL